MAEKKRASPVYLAELTQVIKGVSLGMEIELERFTNPRYLKLRRVKVQDDFYQTTYYQWAVFVENPHKGDRDPLWAQLEYQNAKQTCGLSDMLFRKLYLNTEDG